MDVNHPEHKQDHVTGDDKFPVDTSIPDRKTENSSEDEKIVATKSPPQVEIPIYNDVERVDQTDLSFAAILKGTAANPLNIFEKKAALINVEIDKFGMGRYQICIWFLCGFGYFLDLAWAQGVGLIVTSIYQEVSIRKVFNRICLTSVTDGCPCTGARKHLFHCKRRIGCRCTLLRPCSRCYWSQMGFQLDLPDYFDLWTLVGRFPGLEINSLCLIFNQAAPKFNYSAICAIYFLASLGLGGNIPIDATIALEFLPHNRRFLVALLSMWQPIGVAIASVIAYGTTAKWRCDPNLPSCVSAGEGEACCTVDDNMGWRYNVIVLGSMTLAVFFLRFFVFRFHESPKFLLARGKEAEAIEVLHKIAKFNKQPPPTLTVDMFAAIDDAATNATSGAHVRAEVPAGTKATTKKVIQGFGKELKRLKGIFDNKLSAYIFILLALTYMVSRIAQICVSLLSMS